MANVFVGGYQQGYPQLLIDVANVIVKRVRGSTENTFSVTKRKEQIRKLLKCHGIEKNHLTTLCEIP